MLTSWSVSYAVLPGLSWRFSRCDGLRPLLSLLLLSVALGSFGGDVDFSHDGLFEYSKGAATATVAGQRCWTMKACVADQVDHLACGRKWAVPNRLDVILKVWGESLGWYAVSTRSLESCEKNSHTINQRLPRSIYTRNGQYKPITTRRRLRRQLFGLAPPVEGNRCGLVSTPLAPRH